MKIQIDKKNLWAEVLPARTNYYSYTTLIAVVTAGNLYITEEKLSPTTTRHVNFLKHNLTYNSIRPLEDLV